MTGGIDMSGGFTLTWNRLIIIIFCLAVLARWPPFCAIPDSACRCAPSPESAMAAAMGIRTDGSTHSLSVSAPASPASPASPYRRSAMSAPISARAISSTVSWWWYSVVSARCGTLLGGTSLGVVNKFLEPYAGAMLGKILVLVFIILFIQKRPRGLFALKGRSIEG